jgi:hypothetical protein
MAGFGVPQPEIARLINISDRTLRTYYRRELDIGATEANLRVANALYTNATKHNNTAAQIFWLRARAGWRDRDTLDNEPDTQPTAVEFSWQPALPPAPTIEAEPEAVLLNQTRLDSS